MTGRRPLPAWLRASRAVGLDRLAATTLGRLPVLLMYHGVAGDPLPHRKFFPEDEFVAHLDAIAKRFEVVSMTRIADWLEHGEPLPPRPLALTFDDAYANLLDLAVPEMARRGMPSTVHTTSVSLTSPGALLWFDEVECALIGAKDLPPRIDLAGHRFTIPPGWTGGAAARAVVHAMKVLPHVERERVVQEIRRVFPCDEKLRRRYRLLDREELSGLPAQGVEIGGHTARHVILSRESAEVQRREIVSNFDAIRDLLGKEPVSLAYPNGRRDDASRSTIAIAREAGYRLAVTADTGIAMRLGSRFTIPRVSGRFWGAYGLDERLDLLPLRAAFSVWART